MTRRLLAVAVAWGIALTWPCALRAQANAVSAGDQSKAATAGKEVLTSKGRTWIDYPMPLFTAIVDQNGKFTATSGTIRVSHADPGGLCAKVQRVYAWSGAVVAEVRFAGGAGLCNFNMGDATLNVPWNSGNDADYAGMCTADRRMAGWQTAVPYHKDLTVAMAYNSGKAEDLAGAQRPLVAVGCSRTPCTSLAVRAGATGAQLPEAAAGKAYTLAVFSGGRAPVTYDAQGLPPGLQMRSDGSVSGTAMTPGSYPVTITASDVCPRAQSARVQASLKVKDSQAPTVASFTVTPDTVISNGGDVTLSVQASDNIAVGRIMMTTRHPDGHTGSAQVPMTGGTAANGTWKITFPLAGNFTSTAVSYAFTISASDLDGNAVQAGPRTVVVAAHAQQPLRLPPPRP